MRRSAKPLSGYYLTTDWRRSPGEIVELRIDGQLYRRGVVDAVMRDGSGVWVAADGPYLRALHQRGQGIQLWVQDPPIS
jgi:hypothetical protein